MKSLNDPLEIIFVVLNFVARFRVPNVDHEGVNIRDSKFRDPRVPTKITCYTVRMRKANRGLPMCTQRWISFPSSLRRWEVWQRTLSPPSALSGRPLLRGSAPKTPPPAPSISSTESPSPCGGRTPAFGCTASQPSPPQWTV